MMVMMRKKYIQPIDEEFAAAADDFFARNIVRTDREGADLSALLDTLERVDTAFDSSAEDEAREQIRKNLRKVWFEVEAEKVEERPGLLSQIRDIFGQNKPRVRLAVSFAMALLILAVVPSLFDTELKMAGTAGSFSFPPFLTVILFVGLLSTLFFILKQPKK
jgi:hypothetical protein